MGWADGAIVRLQEGKVSVLTPHGNSMTPRIRSGQKVWVRPVQPASIAKGDVVLVKVNGAVYLHLVLQRTPDNRFLIGNNKGRTNGWVDASHIYGKADA